MATPTLVDHLSTSTNYSGSPEYTTQGPSASSTTFIFSKPNAALSGNCLILTVNCPYSVSRTITITTKDITGASTTNTWVNQKSVNNGTTMTTVFTALNCAVGTVQLTVVFDAALNNVNFKLSEWYNVATASAIDGTSGTTTSATGTIATGAITTAVDGDLIYHTGNSVATPTVGSATITAIAPGSGFTLLSACIFLGYFEQYQVQTTHGSTLNPTVTLTGSTEAFNTIAIALKSASAGTAPTIAIRVVGVYHVWADRNATFQFPCSGNMIYFAAMPYIVASATEWQITSLTSSPSNTFTELSPGGANQYSGQQMPQCYYALSASTSATLTLTVGGLNATHGKSMVIYDVVGVSGFSHQNNCYINVLPQAATTNFTALTYSPSYAEELVFFTSSINVGVIKSHVGTAGVIFDTVTYNGATNADLMDNVDCYSHYHVTSGSVVFGMSNANAVNIADDAEGSAAGFYPTGATVIQMPNIVQSIFGKTLASPNITEVALNATTTGNTLLVVAAGYDGATVRTVSSVAASTGTAVFAKIIAQVGTSNYTSLEAWVAPGIVGGAAPTITVVFSGAVTDGMIWFCELSNMPSVTTQDGTAAGKAGTTATALTAPSITTTLNAYDIIFTAFTGTNNINTGTTGWFQSRTVDKNGSADTGAMVQCEVVTSLQTALIATATEASTGVYGSIVFALQATPPPTLPSFSINPKIIYP